MELPISVSEHTTIANTNCYSKLKIYRHKLKIEGKSTHTYNSVLFNSFHFLLQNVCVYVCRGMKRNEVSEVQSNGKLNNYN